MAALLHAKFYRVSAGFQYHYAFLSARVEPGLSGCCTGGVERGALQAVQCGGLAVGQSAYGQRAPVGGYEQGAARFGGCYGRSVERAVKEV